MGSNALQGETSGASYNVSVPEELAHWFADQYSHEDRLRLASAASEAAISDIPEAYATPFIRQAAINAAKYALGIASLPSEAQEGEQ